MATHFSAHGTNTGTGTYDFRSGVVLLPSGATASQTPAGANIQFISPSGRLALWDGSVWKSVALAGTPAAPAAPSGLDPSQLPATVSGMVQEWFEPSGIVNNSITTQSGVTGWERNTFGVLGQYSFKFTQGVGNREPFVESGTLNGYRNLWYGPVNGNISRMDCASANNEGGNDASRSWFFVLEDKTPMTLAGAQVFVSYAQSTIATRYVCAFVGDSTHPSGAFGYQITGDNNPIVIMVVPGVVPKNTPTIVSVIHSGTNCDIFRNGKLMASSGCDVDSLVGVNVAGMGSLRRNTYVSHCSGLRMWEQIYIVGTGLGTTDRESIENYLSSKYNLALER